MVRPSGTTAAGLPAVPAMVCCIIIAACAGFGLGVAISTAPEAAYYAAVAGGPGTDAPAYAAGTGSGFAVKPAVEGTTVTLSREPESTPTKPSLLVGTPEKPAVSDRSGSHAVSTDGVVGVRLANAGGEKGARLDPSRAPIDLTIPVAGPISSGFGYRWGRLHEGIDIASSHGHPVRAAAAGVVRYAGYRGTYGYLIVLAHEQNTETFYGHLSKILVKVGQKVEKGAVIGRVGSTGHSTGPHLHFEVRVRGRPLDPSYVLGINLS